MTQMVFIHGPGAGGCAESFVYQLEHYLGSLAPTLPGHPEGAACTSVERYAEWLRGWLWSQGKRKELVLVGYTLGGCIALQYALDYPDEVKALVLMTTGMRPRERAPGGVGAALESHGESRVLPAMAGAHAASIFVYGAGAGRTSRRMSPSGGSIVAVS